MKEQRFGGVWTQEKLERLEKYLRAYTQIFEKNERAQFLRTVYVDAFAGSGYIASRAQSGADVSLFPELREGEAQEFLKGSAHIALDVEPAFDHYLFIEKEANYAEELHRLKNLHHNAGRSIEIVQADANEFLPMWVEKQDWKKTRAVVFLDPYSMEVDWETLKILASGRLDLWLLWPIGQAINRLLTTKKLPPDSWGEALTRAFGTEEWKPRFYAAPTQTRMDFGDEEAQESVKIADFKQIEQFFIERLKTLFPFVASNPLYLRNSQNTPLFLLCFAAHNATALKIAQDVLKD